MAAPVRINTVHVAGIHESVNQAILHAAFVPFGEILEVSLPQEPGTGKHRGFAFITYEEAEDAAAAIDNMHDNELYGKTLSVTLAKPAKYQKGSDLPVWQQPEWIDQHRGADGEATTAGAAAGSATE